MEIIYDDEPENRDEIESKFSSELCEFAERHRIAGHQATLSFAVKMFSLVADRERRIKEARAKAFEEVLECLPRHPATQGLRSYCSDEMRKALSRAGNPENEVGQ